MASKNKEYEVLKMSTPYTKPLASDPVLSSPIEFLYKPSSARTSFPAGGV